MHRLFALALILLAGLLVACATPHVISTTDGAMIPTADAPELDEETGMYQYTDEEGRTHEISKDKVVQILER
jgi:hypothetical protein